MSVAVITGASSGLGRAYALALARLRPEISEYWLLARREDRMEALAKELPGIACKILPMDLKEPETMETFVSLLEKEKPDISLLIDNAGFGKLGDFEKLPVSELTDMVGLNCAALTWLTRVALPYMKEGAGVLMVSSIAAFVPNARMAVYSSTKAYVLSLARALRFELKSRQINVLAVCPGPMDTEFLAVANIPGRSKTFNMLPRVKMEHVAEKSLRALFAGRAIYVDRYFYKTYHLLSKVLPKAWLMPAAKC